MYKNDIILEDILAEIIQFRRWMHQHPELSLAEIETSKKLIEILAQHGITASPIHNGVGVTTLIEGNGPKTIALRADIDALPLSEKTDLDFASVVPQIMHACGHDIHTSILLGATIVLHQQRHLLPGNIRIIFQPAEEKLSGSQIVLDSNLLDEPPVDYIVTNHTWPDLDGGTIGLINGPAMASSDAFTIEITGTGGHAAHPHKAKDPIVTLAAVIQALQTIVSREVAPLESAVLTIGKVSAGTAGNIIPDKAYLQGTVRTLNNDYRKKIEDSIHRICQGIADTYDQPIEVTYTHQSPALINDDKLYHILESSLDDSIGKENVRYLPSPSLGSEDFALYLEKIPGILYRVGTGNNLPASRVALHNPTIVFDEAAIPTGIRAMVGFAQHLLKELSHEEK